MSKVFRFIPTKNTIYNFAREEKEIVFVAMPLLTMMHYYMYKEFCDNKSMSVN
jgi:hypothetical protein